MSLKFRHPSDYRQFVIAITLVAAASLIAFLFFYSERRRSQLEREQARQAEALSQDPALLEAQNQGDEVELELYFYVPRKVSGGDDLTPLKRRLYRTDDPVTMARQIVNDLVRGVEDSPKFFPAEAKLRQIYLLEDGTAIVDLSGDIPRSLPGDARSELALLRSISTSLIANVDRIVRVKFLVEGEDRETFAGHVSLRDPFM